MEKHKTWPVRLRLIIARDDVLLTELLEKAANEASAKMRQPDGSYEWSTLFDNTWDKHTYQIKLLAELHRVLFETFDVFDLRKMARKFHLSSRLLGELVAKTYERISTDIDYLQKSYPDAIPVSSKIWGINGKVGYEFMLEKAGDDLWQSVI